MLPSDLEYEDSDDTNAQDGFLEIATLLDTSCVGVEIPETVIFIRLYFLQMLQQ
jgi:hypothetical protein